MLIGIMAVDGMSINAVGLASLLFPCSLLLFSSFACCSEAFVRSSCHCHHDHRRPKVVLRSLCAWTPGHHLQTPWYAALYLHSRMSAKMLIPRPSFNPHKPQRSTLFHLLDMPLHPLSSARGTWQAQTRSRGSCCFSSSSSLVKSNESTLSLSQGRKKSPPISHLSWQCNADWWLMELFSPVFALVL